MELPTWSMLTGVQRSVLDTPLDQSLFVAGPPGSGKTVLAIRRAQSVQGSGARVLLLTYNRMLRRSAQLLDDTNRVEVATMHRHCWRDYRERTGETIDSYNWPWGRILRTLHGHRGQPGSAMTHDHLVVDEGQDLPRGFFEYARRYIAPRMSVFADENQIIEANSSTLEAIKVAGALPDPLLLVENHRNTPEIVAVASHFHGGRLPVPELRRPSVGELPRLIQHRELSETCAMIATQYRNHGGSIGVLVDSNGMGQAIRRTLRRVSFAGRRDVRVDFYTNEQANEDNIQIFEPGVTILNHRSVKGQEFDTLFVLELSALLPCPTAERRRMMYMICSRPREHLFMVSVSERLSDAALASLPSPRLLERP